ncbi:hypothetical protein GCM10009528_06980 [Kineococcus aurantiacus]
MPTSSAERHAVTAQGVLIARHPCEFGALMALARRSKSRADHLKQRELAVAWLVLEYYDEYQAVWRN